MNEDLTERVAALEARVDQLEGRRKGGRPGRKIIVTSEGICGLDQSIDSNVCPYASLYRRRQGCLGVACKQAATNYYKDYARDE